MRRVLLCWHYMWSLLQRKPLVRLVETISINDLRVTATVRITENSLTPAISSALLYINNCLYINNVFQLQKNIENVWRKTKLKWWSNLISLTWCNLRENLSFTEKNNSLGNIKTGRHSNRNSQCSDGGLREWYQVKDKQNVYERILFSSVLINGHGLFEVRNSFVCWFWLLW